MVSECNEKRETYKFLSYDLLDSKAWISRKLFDEGLAEQGRKLEQILKDYSINANVIGVTRGPSVTRFEVELAPGVKKSSVIYLADDIALRLAAPCVRVDSELDNAAIGIEVPNDKRDTVTFSEVTGYYCVKRNLNGICVGIGKGFGGSVVMIEIPKMQHLLIKGMQESEKNRFVDTLLAGLMYKASPEKMRLILVDAAQDGLCKFNGLPHLLTPIITDKKQAFSAFWWAVMETRRRVELFRRSRVQNIQDYNSANTAKKLPFIIIVISELSCLMTEEEFELGYRLICLITHAHEFGIHLVLATSRSNRIDSIISEGVKSHIAFAGSSSLLFLYRFEAEKLLGEGDMLYYPSGADNALRVQGAFISEEELNRVISFIRQQEIPAKYNDEVTNVAAPERM